MHPGTFAIGEYPVGESLIGEIREPRKNKGIYKGRSYCATEVHGAKFFSPQASYSIPRPVPRISAFFYIKVSTLY
jgi:hypothetical protein